MPEPEPKPEQWRLFVATELPPAFEKTLAAALRSLDGLEALVRRSPVSGIHLTLAFLGMVETSRIASIETSLRAATSGVDRFAVEIGGSGVFPSPSRPQVVWIGIGGPDRPRLLDLAGRVNAQLRQAGFQLEERPFRPHLTLGRIRARPRPEQLQALRAWLTDWRDRPLGRLEVTAIDLMRSQLSNGPPVYTRLQSFGLQ